MGTVTNEQLTSLPLNGRGFFRPAELTPVPRSQAGNGKLFWRSGLKSSTEIPLANSRKCNLVPA